MLGMDHHPRNDFLVGPTKDLVELGFSAEVEEEEENAA